MRKLIFIILLLPFAAFGQTTYQLNYDSIRVGKTAGTGGTSLYGKTYLKNISSGIASDSLVVIRDGKLFKISGADISSVGFMSYIFSRDVSDIAGYEQMPALSSYTTGTIDTATATVSIAETLLQEFATNSGFPNTTIIPVGIFNVHYDTQKGAGSINYYTYAKIYKRSLAGTETLLATTDNSTQTAVNTVISTSVSSLISTQISLLTTDRIVVKVYAKTLSSTASINLYYDNATNARLEFPSALVNATNFVPYAGAIKDLVSAFSIQGDSIKITGGLSTQFLKANGSVDATIYQTALSGTGIVKSTAGTISYLTEAAASTPSTLAFRDGAGSISFKAINLDTDGGTAITSSSQTTGQVLATWSNTSGSLKWGIENSVGGNYATGLTAYSSFLGTATNTPLMFFTNGVLRQTISGTGVTTFAGTIASPTISDPVIANISPTANFTLTQNSIVPFTSVSAGAIVNTLYLDSGKVAIGRTNARSALEISAPYTGSTGQLRITSTSGDFAALSLWDNATRKVLMYYDIGAGGGGMFNITTNQTTFSGPIYGTSATFSSTGTLGSVWQASITNGTQSLKLGANSTAAEIQSTGGVPLYINYGGNTTVFGAPIRLKGYTVATLPAGTQGDTAFVTDSAVGAGSYGAVVVGGGSVVTGVFYNGTNWVTN